MPNERVSMSKLKQLIALHTSNLSVRAMGRALGLSVGAVSKYLRAVRAAGITADEAVRLSEMELERRVRRAHGADLRGARGGILPRAAVRQRPRGERLRVRGGDPHPVAAGLAGEPLVSAYRLMAIVD